MGSVSLLLTINVGEKKMCLRSRRGLFRLLAGLRSAHWAMVTVVLGGLGGGVAEVDAEHFSSNDGGEHTIDTKHEIVTLRNSLTGVGTTVNVVDGAELGHLSARENSAINMSGGVIIYLLSGYEDSTIAVTGGIVGHDLVTHGRSTLQFSGGQVGQFIEARGDSTALLSGGRAPYAQVWHNASMTITGGSFFSLLAKDSSKMDVSGGTLQRLTVRDRAQVHISDAVFPQFGHVNSSEESHVTLDGGIFWAVGATDRSILTINRGSIVSNVRILGEASAMISGGAFDQELLISGNAMVDVYGGSFQDQLTLSENPHVVFHGTGFNYDPGLVSDLTGTLTGFLDNGDYLELPFNRSSGGAITLVIPEPAGAVIIAVMVPSVLLKRWPNGAGCVSSA